MTRITVIVPTFNRLRDLEVTLDALAQQSFRAFAVVVVDNGSTDGTEAAMIARAASPGPFPLRYLRIDPSGPAGARNAGIAAATTPYLAFVDSDVSLDPAWLAIAAAALDTDPGIPAIGGALVYANDPGYLNAFGGTNSRIGLAWDIGEGEPVGVAESPADRLWINCSAMLARSEAVRAAGGFDGRFFYGFEDSDLGWRMTIARGPLHVLPELRALHRTGDDIGAAAAPIVFHASKNRLASLIANASWRMLAVYGPLYLSYAIVDALLRPPRRPKVAALLWNIGNLRGTIARRRSLPVPAGGRCRAETLIAARLFPDVRLGGMRRRPNRIQRDAGTRIADDRVSP